MKKIVFIASLSIFTLIGCTKSDDAGNLQKSSINFDTRVGKGSKAIPIEGTDYPTDMPFSVFAFYKGTTTYDYNTPYINDTYIGYTGGVWKADDPIYWPLGGFLKFVAYAPWTAPTPTYSEADGLTFTNYTINVSGNVENDLMYTADDAAVDLTATSYAGTVPLTFKHALTQIYFAATTSIPEYVFTIKKIEIENVVTRGTLKEKSGWTPSAVAGDKGTYVYYEYDPDGGEDVLVTSVDPHIFTERKLLIPQSVDAVTVTVTYDIKDPLNNVGTAITKTVTLSGDWSMNQKVKYTLGFLPGAEITYIPSITDWAAETAGTTN